MESGGIPKTGGTKRVYLVEMTQEARRGEPGEAAWTSLVVTARGSRESGRLHCRIVLEGVSAPVEIERGSGDPGAALARLCGSVHLMRGFTETLVAEALSLASGGSRR